jgi:hypothetical protein
VTETPRAADLPSGAPWLLAVRGGAVSFACVALGALAIGILEWLAAGRPFGLRLSWKLAGLYVGAFHGAGVRALGSGLPGEFSATGLADVEVPITLHVTLLLGTTLAASALWSTGRSVARRAGGTLWWRLAWGSAVAPVYSLLVFGVSLVVVLRFPASGIIEVRLLSAEALVRSLVVGVVAGAAGGFASFRDDLEPSGSWGARTIAWVAGGWHMTVALMVLALGGFLVVAGVEADVSTAYVRFATGSATGAVVATHHVLLLPNQSLLIAAPAMGGCVELGSSDSAPSTLCLRELTLRPGWGELIFDRSSGVLALSPAWLLFLLVPGLATVWGGRAAAIGAGSVRERALRGAGAGVVFAAAVAAGVAVSAISVTRSGQELIVLGADVGRTAALGLAWGVGGGVLGSVWLGRSQTGGVPEAGSGPEPEEPPSATSV